MQDADEIMALLKAEGFDTVQAMEICAEDTEIYMEVLETAMEEGGRKLPIIERSIENKDYERYYIEVHALKNAARAIGAMELSELAREQEKAAKQGEHERMEKESITLIEKYRDMLGFLEKIMT